MKLFLILTCFSLGLVARADAVQIETSGSNPYCEELSVMQPLRVFRDPALFLSNLNMLSTDPENGWEAMQEESPLLTTLGTGRARFMRLGPAAPFRNFRAIARFYEPIEPALKAYRLARQEQNPYIVPIKICGGDSYNDTLGFVFLSDLKMAETNPFDPEGLPPSTRTIPNYPATGGSLVRK
jgi:hypothetical protein